jgi:hypothetical protein
MLRDDLRKTLDMVLALTGSSYLVSPLPSAADDDIATLMDRFAKGDAALRDEVARSISGLHADLLMVFAIRMAILGVREQSGARLRIGLLAVALAGSSPESDWRDVFYQMPPLEDAGLRIPGDLRAAYVEAASIAKGRVAILIRGAFPPRHAWLRRTKRLKLRLLGGGWRAVQAPDGFRYVVTNPISEVELMDKIANALRESSTSQP